MIHLAFGSLGIAARWARCKAPRSTRDYRITWTPAKSSRRLSYVTSLRHHEAIRNPYDEYGRRQMPIADPRETMLRGDSWASRIYVGVALGFQGFSKNAKRCEAIISRVSSRVDWKEGEAEVPLFICAKQCTLLRGIRWHALADSDTRRTRKRERERSERAHRDARPCVLHLRLANRQVAANRDNVALRMTHKHTETHTHMHTYAHTQEAHVSFLEDHRDREGEAVQCASL